MSVLKFAFGSHSANGVFDGYADLETANEYHNSRQTANEWARFDDTEKQQRLTSASDLIDRLFPLGYIGQPENASQTRAFPRFLPNNHEAITPVVVVQACCELALLNDISGCLPNPQKVKEMGGALWQDGECSSEDKQQYHALKMIVLLLEPYRLRQKLVRLERG